MHDNRFTALWLVLVLVLALVAGCGSTQSPTDRAVQLDQRLNSSLVGEVQERRVLIGQLPDGSRLIVDSRLLFPAYNAQLPAYSAQPDEHGQQFLNRVIEAVFAVWQTRVAIDACPRGLGTAYDGQFPRMRATNLIRYLQKQGFDPELLSVTTGSTRVAAAPAYSGSGACDGQEIAMDITVK